METRSKRTAKAKAAGKKTLSSEIDEAPVKTDETPAPATANEPAKNEVPIDELYRKILGVDSSEDCCDSEEEDEVKQAINESWKLVIKKDPVKVKERFYKELKGAAKVSWKLVNIIPYDENEKSDDDAKADEDEEEVEDEADADETDADAEIEDEDEADEVEDDDERIYLAAEIAAEITAQELMKAEEWVQSLEPVFEVMRGDRNLSLAGPRPTIGVLTVTESNSGDEIEMEEMQSEDDMISSAELQFRPPQRPRAAETDTEGTRDLSYLFKPCYPRNDSSFFSRTRCEQSLDNRLSSEQRRRRRYRAHFHQGGTQGGVFSYAEKESGCTAGNPRAADRLIRSQKMTVWSAGSPSQFASTNEEDVEEKCKN